MTDEIIFILFENIFTTDKSYLFNNVKEAKA